MSDLGGENRGLHNELGITGQDSQNYFLDPSYPDEKKIFVFADWPHLIKLMRENVLKNGFTLKNGTTFKIRHQTYKRYKFIFNI